jgi:hypothetical protein
MTTRPTYPQVYGPDGKYIGFFTSLESAKSYVNGREGYEISDRKPTRAERL